jgi:hypothetical protein
MAQGLELGVNYYRTPSFGLGLSYLEPSLFFLLEPESEPMFCLFKTTKTGTRTTLIHFFIPTPKVRTTAHLVRTISPSPSKIKPNWN